MSLESRGIQTNEGYTCIETRNPNSNHDEWHKCNDNFKQKKKNNICGKNNHENDIFTNKIRLLRVRD